MNTRERKTFIRTFAMRQSTREMLEKLAVHYDRTPGDTLEFIVRAKFEELENAKK